jgi:phosphatidate cytidylyltransferase
VLFQLVAWHGEGRAFDPFLPGFLTLIVLAIMLVELVKPKQKPILNIGTTLLGCIYIGWLFSYLVLLHETTLPMVVPLQGTTSGEWLVILLLAITSSNDSGALLVGSLIGKHKLAPNISPSKTWEGAVGGVIIASMVSYGFAVLLHLPNLEILLAGAALATVGLIGDLCESAMKRELGVKDFGMILPGHGGVLDRVDSILFIAPVGYYLLEGILRHG